MAWTATLLSAQDRQTYWKIQVVFSDSETGRTAERGYRFSGGTASELRAFVRNKALEFGSVDSGVDLIQFEGQSIDVTPPTPVEPTPPTQAELDRQAWFNDYRQLQRMLKVTGDVPALLTAQAQTAINNLRASLSAGWLNSYLDGV